MELVCGTERGTWNGNVRQGTWNGADVWDIEGDAWNGTECETERGNVEHEIYHMEECKTRQSERGTGRNVRQRRGEEHGTERIMRQTFPSMGRDRFR